MNGRSQKPEVVLVSWISVNHGAAPLLTAIEDPESPFCGKVTHVVLCWRDGKDNAQERTRLRETTEALGGLGHDTHAWKSKAAPTDHAKLRPFAEKVLRTTRQRHPEAHVVILLSPGTPAMHAVWLLLGSTGFIEGKVSLIQTADPRARAAGQAAVTIVDISIDTWLRRYRESQPLHAGADDDGHGWDPARAQSEGLRRAMAEIDRWAPLRVPVLMVGERGTGKTTLANLLRARSPYYQHAREWPVVVCGQFRVNPELARSELFGHAKGSFTGANEDRVGLLERADGDTLFLDEIADIDRDTQRLLMAAIEGRGFHRLGDPKPRQSSFRLVSATNRTLDQLRGEILDWDFYDRISAFVLRVPPLRECRADLPQIWASVLCKARQVAQVDPPGWADFVDHRQVLALLSTHSLPGNFRDLQRGAYHLLAALAAEQPPATALAALRSALGADERQAKGWTLPDARALPLSEGVDSQIAAYQDAWFDAALERSAGNQTKAAELLGMPRKTFDSRRKQRPRG